MAWSTLARLISSLAVLAALFVAVRASALDRGESSRVVATQPTVAPPTALPTVAPTATVAPTPAPRYAEIRPNELGKIMILEYHVIGDEEERWTRTRKNFRADLEYLYRNGYYLVGVHDLIENRVRAPAGKTPVVLTFDDSNRSQFQLLTHPDGRREVDPSTGLGILETFLTQRPDIGRAATFCVLPGADPPNDLFGQPPLRQQKLQYLAAQGYELCNHTLWHARLNEIDRAETVRQLALAQKAIQDAVPGYQVHVFNPPGGVYPDDLAPVIAGSFDGISYQHRAILEVSGGPMTAPNHRQTDFFHLPRIQAIPTSLEHYFGFFERHPEQRYVSDGDPDRVVFPAALVGDLRPETGAIEEPSPDPHYKVVRLR